MKPIFKLLISALAVCLIGASVFGLVAFASTDDGKNGTFNGSPAHIDENGDLIIDDINFPDKNFREYVSEFDTDKDGFLSKEEIISVNMIRVDNSVESLVGIEYFTDAVYINCSGSKVSELDLSKNTKLEYLNCEGSGITKLDLSECSNLGEAYLGPSVMFSNIKFPSKPALYALSCGTHSRYDSTANAWNVDFEPFEDYIKAQYPNATFDSFETIYTSENEHYYYYW